MFHMKKTETPETPAPSSEEVLLSGILDLLKGK